jgi:hypothetical protein
MNTKQEKLKRAYEYLRYIGEVHTQGEFASEIVFDETNLSSAFNGREKNLTDGLFTKICKRYPNIFNIDYFISDAENMLRGTNVNKGDINGVGQIVQNNSGSITLTNNGSKDKVIEQQDKSLEALTEQLVRFHEVVMNKDEQIERKDAHILRKDEQIERKDEQLERKDGYIVGQKEQIDNITKHSFLRNERNMERIDKFVEQQNKLIEMVVSQNIKMQERADRLLALLEKKI